MSTKTKYLIASAIAVAAVFLEVYGISTMLKLRAPGGFKGIGSVVAGLVIGAVAALFHYYYKAVSSQPRTQDQVAVETLSKLPKRPKRNT